MNLRSDYGLVFLSYFYNLDISTISRVTKSMPDLMAFKASLPPTNETIDQIEWALRETDYCMEAIRYIGGRIIPYNSTEYPKGLFRLKSPPPVLYIKGRIPIEKSIAVVGSRNPASSANRIVDEFFESISGERVSIVSGLALGVDSMAHTKSMHLKMKNIAYLPSAIDTIYPKENIRLANQILENDGCLISELPFGINRGKRSFVARDRLQAAHSALLFPVDFSENSGTMHSINTARTIEMPIVLFSNKTYQQNNGIEYLKSSKYSKLIVVESFEGFSIGSILEEATVETRSTSSVIQLGLEL